MRTPWRSSILALLPLALLPLGGRGLRAQRAEVGHRIVGCDGCHGSHLQAAERAPKLVKRTADQSRRAAMRAPAVEGLSPLSSSCLRCHFSSDVRRAEMTHGEVARAGGEEAGTYVGSRLQDSHPMSGDGRRPQCTTCHLLHVPGQLLPSGMQQRFLCIDCHADLAVHPDRSHAAEACGSCHQNHGGMGWITRKSAGPSAVRAGAEAIGPQAILPPAAGAPVGIMASASIARAAEAKCTGCHVPPGGTEPPTRRDGPTARLSAEHLQRGVRCLECHMKRTAAAPTAPRRVLAAPRYRGLLRGTP